ncbi:hypothetical protein [Pseudorhodoferax sp. Leaf267]|uniref:hypothetical protein n=1 Tax=Pseudorhodoferax sp. Leaf267 TaxID=1736316 RepID=UPI00070162B8|nr:hypothetical protein [Pseudorhodoferax sp. Leaf267]KQP20563.1 hypothetical protein ASF43_27450 [Pseudorhodoferax sp. Leaf267]
MDDEDTKARRNFIAVSTVILLVWWLQLPAQSIFEKLLGLRDVSTAFEWRVWVATSAALLYFALRFRFSGSHETSVEEMRKEAARLRNLHFRRWMSIESFVLRKWKYTPPVIKAALRDSLHFEILFKELGTAKRHIKVRRAIVAYSDDGRDERAWGPGTQIAKVDLDVMKPNGGGTVTTETVIRCPMPPVVRHFLNSTVACFLLTYAKASLAIFYPWIAGICAASVCAWRTWQAFGVV